MSEPETVTERCLRRSIHYQNIRKSLKLLVPTLLLWWFLFHWVAHHFDVANDLAELGSLLVILVGVSALPKQIRLTIPDWRPTPRLRWLQKEAYAHFRSRLRGFWIVGILGFLLSGVATLFLDQTSPTPVVSCGFLIMLMIITQTILWKLPYPMDELARAHYLTATRLAYLVTVIACVGGLILDVHWPNRLPAMVTLSLLAGMLTHQVSLAVLERQATPRDD